MPTRLGHNRPVPPNPPKEPNVDGKSTIQAAAIQQKYNNAKAAYPAKLQQYNDFIPLLNDHIAQAQSLIFTLQIV